MLISARRRTAALALSLTLPLSIGLLPVGAAQAEEVAADRCAAAAGDAVSAATLAAACDQDVVIADSVTPWAQTVAQPDGRFRYEASITASRSLSADGTWVSVDASIAPDPVGGRYELVAPAVEMSFSDGTDGEPLAEVVKDGHRLTLDVPFDLGAPVVLEDRLEYPVIEGVDVIVTVSSDGSSFTEVIRVADPGLLEDPVLAGLTDGGLVLPVEISDELKLVEDPTTGNLNAIEESTGEVVMTAPVPRAWDSAADAVLEPLTETEAVALAGREVVAEVIAEAKAAGEGVGRREPAVADRAAQGTASPTAPGLVATPDGLVLAANGVAQQRAAAPLTGDAVAALDVKVVADRAGEAKGLALSVDPALVENAQGELYIDPSVSGSLQGRAYIQSAFPDTAHWNGETPMPVGVCTAKIGCSPTNENRSIWQFTGLEQVAAMDGGDISSATFKATGIHSYNCDARWVELWHTGAISPGTTFNNFAYTNYMSGQSSHNIAHKPECPNPNHVREIAWDATPAARYTADHNASQLTLGLYAPQTDVETWKRYDMNAKLEIIGERPPFSPDSYGIAGEPCGTSGAPELINVKRPVFQWVVRDPDSLVVPNLDVVQLGASGFFWDRPEPLNLAQGSPAAFSVHSAEENMPDLVHNETYEVRFGGRNVPWDPGRWGPLASCWYKVDLAQPGAPAVSYTRDGSTGQITFRFAPGSAADNDIAKYNYGIGTGGALNEDAEAGTGGVATVTPPLVGGGDQYLWVQAVDKATNVSTATTVLRFTTALTGLLSRWGLNESTGAAINSVTTGPAQHPNLERPARVVSPSTLVGSFDAEAGGLGRGWDLTAGATSAATSGPILNTVASYTVTAWLKTGDPASAGMTAVTQDGRPGYGYGGFKVGQMAAASCTRYDGSRSSTPCYALWASAPDTGGGVRNVAGPSVSASGWTFVAGVYRAAVVNGAGTVTTPGELQVWTCVQDPQSPDLIAKLVDKEAFTELNASTGPFRIGQGQTGPNGFNETWVGGIDDVRVYQQAGDATTLTAACNGLKDWNLS